MFFFQPIIDLINMIFQLFFWGIVIIIGALVFRALSKSGTVAEEEIIERWGCLVPNQAKTSEEFITMVQAELDARDCPYEISKKTFFLGFSESNPFIRVKLNFAYSCYIGYEIIGKDIYFTWSVREKMSWIYRIPFLGPLLYRIFHVVSFIDRNKLLAFASFTNSCTENAVESLMDKYKIENIKMPKATSGKLGPI